MSLGAVGRKVDVVERAIRRGTGQDPGAGGGAGAGRGGRLQRMMRVLDVCDGALGRCFVGSGSASTA